MTNVKICGITNLEDGLNAVSLGADYIGFVFYEKSSRHINVQDATDISKRLTGVKKVGLFVNEAPEKVMAISTFVELDVLQFHGNEKPLYCSELTYLGKEIWKAIRVESELSLAKISEYDSIDAFVLDSYVKEKLGGTGETFDWELAKQAKNYGKKIILAGGLDSLNVKEAISMVSPFAVDVSSGVEESKGKKSYEKMKEFIDAVKSSC